MSARANGDDLATHQGDSPARTVTSNRRPGRSAAERKRDQRARDAKNGLLFERQDWMLFLSPATLPQKAGCQPGDLRALVLREITDNALDNGAHINSQRSHADRFIITRFRRVPPQPEGRAAAVRRQPTTGIEQAPRGCICAEPSPRLSERWQSAQASTTNGMLAPCCAAIPVWRA